MTSADKIIGAGLLRRGFLLEYLTLAVGYVRAVYANREVCTVYRGQH